MLKPKLWRGHKKKQTAKQLGICLNLKYDNLDMKILIRT